MMFNELEIAKKAIEIRNQNNIGTNGIKDIFSLVENMGIDLIRYPFGKDGLLGFCTIYKGKPVIVSNSSSILSREIFTIAHESAHIIYDFTDDKGNIIVDTIEKEQEKTISEQRANYFAACLLMPVEKIDAYFTYTLEKNPKDISCIDIVRMQIEFQVSYEALIYRLDTLKKIGPTKKDLLLGTRDYNTLKSIFDAIGAGTSLLEASNKLIVPQRYYEYVIYNYSKGYIPKSSFDKALALLKANPEVFLIMSERD